jgi:hypothetical protein
MNGSTFFPCPRYGSAVNQTLELPPPGMASAWGAPAPLGLICEILFATPFTTPFPHIYGGCDVAVLKGRIKRTIELVKAHRVPYRRHAPSHLHHLSHAVYLVAVCGLFGARVPQAIRS